MRCDADTMRMIARARMHAFAAKTTERGCDDGRREEDVLRVLRGGGAGAHQLYSVVAGQASQKINTHRLVNRRQ